MDDGNTCKISAKSAYLKNYRYARKAAKKHTVTQGVNTTLVNIKCMMVIYILSFHLLVTFNLPSVAAVQKLHWNLRPPSMNII